MTITRNPHRRGGPIWMPTFLHELETMERFDFSWMLLYVIWLTVGAPAPTDDSEPMPSRAARTFRVTDEWIESVRFSTSMSPRQIESALANLHERRFIRLRFIGLKRPLVRVELPKGEIGWSRMPDTHHHETGAPA